MTYIGRFSYYLYNILMEIHIEEETKKHKLNDDFNVQVRLNEFKCYKKFLK